jgi:adenosylcobyric acid synthase
VRPFKPQNMSNNAAVADIPGAGRSGEIGRAQWLQALACGTRPTVHMNPVLLKPQSETGSQIVVQGRVAGEARGRDYQRLKPQLLAKVLESFAALSAEADLVIVEGAGSPAEINLRAGDIANMGFATAAEVPVVLVGDIDRGGVFAHLVGTLELLDPDERARVKGFFINKFRGDVSLLAPGLEFLEQKTGVPVLGVIPYLQDLHVPDEDSVALEGRIVPSTGSRSRDGPPGDEPPLVDVAVVALPHIANFDDFDPLAREPRVRVRYVDAPAALGTPDMVVLPGTKTTLADLRWLRARGLDAAVLACARRGNLVAGICGGYQMLGRRIEDPTGAESSPGDSAEGLGLLPVRTVFDAEKATHQVHALVAGGHGPFVEAAGAPIAAYEIHMGRTHVLDPGARPAFGIVSRADVPGPAAAGPETDGLLSADGRVFGTYLHGLFDNGALRGALLRFLAARNGRLAEAGAEQVARGWGADSALDDQFDRLAAAVRASVDVPRLYQIAGLHRGVAAP